MERLYHLVYINERTGQETVLTAYPATHKECMTMKSKLTSYWWRNIVLREIV